MPPVPANLQNHFPHDDLQLNVVDNKKCLELNVMQIYCVNISDKNLNEKKDFVSSIIHIYNRLWLWLDYSLNYA